jgi:hypothetical protein
MRITLLACFLLVALSGFCNLLGQTPAETSEVVFDTRVVNIPVETPPANCPRKQSEVTFLNDEQLKAILESVHGDRCGQVLQLPRMTVEKGQAMTCQCLQKQTFVTGLDVKRGNGVTACVPRNEQIDTGWTFTIRGTISADRNYIHTSLNFQETRIERCELVPVVTQVTPLFEGGSHGQPVPFTQYLQSPLIETTLIEKAELSIPSGGSVAIAGPTFAKEIRREFGDPFLTSLPYVGRLFSNVGITRIQMRTVLIVSAQVRDPIAPKTDAKK